MAGCQLQFCSIRLYPLGGLADGKSSNGYHLCSPNWARCLFFPQCTGQPNPYCYHSTKERAPVCSWHLTVTAACSPPHHVDCWQPTWLPRTLIQGLEDIQGFVVITMRRKWTREWYCYCALQGSTPTWLNRLNLICWAVNRDRKSLSQQRSFKGQMFIREEILAVNSLTSKSDNAN